MTLSCSKKLSALLEQKPNLNHIKRYVKIKDFYNVTMPPQDTKILEFNQYQKSDKAPFHYFCRS